MSEREKALSGAPYRTREPELLALYRRARALRAKLAADSDMAGVRGRLPGSAGAGVWIEAPFHCDYGVNIHAGADVFVNANCVFLDGARIEIGRSTLVGPAVQLLTVSHPLRPEDRLTEAPGGASEYVTWARPITIGAEAWICAGAIILPGVTIGDGAVVAAGSVVTEDVAPRCVCAGNPARFVRHLDEDRP